MKRVKIIIIIILGFLLAACSTTYKPSNYKPKKNKKCDCSKWSMKMEEKGGRESVLAFRM